MKKVLLHIIAKYDDWEGCLSDEQKLVAITVDASNHGELRPDC